MNELSNLKNNQMMIIIEPDSKKRKLIHQYLDNIFPDTHHISLQLNNFYSHVRGISMKCSECNHRNILKNYFSRDSCCDSGWGDWCDKCDNYLFESDCCKCDKFVLKKNNAIVISTYIKNYKTTNISTHKLNEIDSIITSISFNIQKYMIRSPIKQLKKDELRSYICEYIRGIERRKNMPNKWSVAHHHKYPSHYKKIIEIFLCCVRSSNITLYWDIVEIIIDFICY